MNKMTPLLRTKSLGRRKERKSKKSS